MTKRRTESVRDLGAELFFFAVAGEEDLAVLVEVVNRTFDGVGRGRSHGSEGYARGASSQDAAGAELAESS
jgi:hypothetical protein